MIRVVDRFVLGLVLGWLTIVLALIGLGETRADAYAALTILVYFAIVSLFRGELGVHKRWVLDLLLAILFTAMVGYRVWLVLAG